MSQNPRLETVETLAARFGLPRRTIIREVMTSRLPYVSVAGNWRFRERDIELWLQRTGPLPRISMLRGGLETDGDTRVRRQAQQAGESAF